METFILILLLILLITLPLFILRYLIPYLTKNKFVYYLITALIMGGIVAASFAWWNDDSKITQLKQYGYNIDGMSKAELYEKVAEENIPKVKNLETSIMGVGWPAKAIMFFPIYIIYILLAYVFFEAITRNKDSLP